MPDFAIGDRVTIPADLYADGPRTGYIVAVYKGSKARREHLNIGKFRVSENPDPDPFKSRWSAWCHSHELTPAPTQEEASDA